MQEVLPNLRAQGLEHLAAAGSALEALVEEAELDLLADQEPEAQEFRIFSDQQMVQHIFPSL